MNVALVHDYLTQRGGAERVVLAMVKAFPGAPVHTSLYEPDATFPAFADVDVRPMPINRLRPLRTDHRRALPILPVSFSGLRIHADLVICSSSGWAHGAAVEGRKVVYCHTPARWLYRTAEYLGRGRPVAAAAVRILRRPFEAWDRRAAATADLYLVPSTAIRDLVREVYGAEAEVLPPPPAIVPDGSVQGIDGLEPGYYLCVSRLLPYKNVDAVAAAFEEGDRILAVAGTGPEEARLRRRFGHAVRFLGSVSDEELRWLYANCRALVSASYEDFGLTPLEAAGFGRPAVVLRAGGFLDTVVEDETGVMFDLPDPGSIRSALARAERTAWAPDVLRRRAERFSEERFLARLRDTARTMGVGDI